MSSRLSWSAQRRLGIDLRRGEPIPEDQRADACEVIDLHKRYGWVTWAWGILGLGWLVIAYYAEGNQRWADVALGALMVGFSFVQVRRRRRIVGREPEMAGPKLF